MTIQRWKKVDRFGLLSALTDLSTSPGLLLVVGDDDSDRTTAADVAEDFLSDLQWEVIRVRQVASRATTTHQVLARAWGAVDDPTGSLDIPRSLSQARHMSEAEIVAEIGRACIPRTQRSAFVFDTVDPLDRMPRDHTRFFQDLVRVSGCSVIVFSRTESGTEAPLHCRSVALGDLPMYEVRMSLKTASDFVGYDEADIDHLVAELDAISADGHLTAYDAYALIQDRIGRLTRRAN